MPSQIFHQTVNTVQPSEVEILPQYIPSSDTDLVTSDFHVTEITLANVTAGTVTVTIHDKQTTPLALFQAVAIAANSTYGATFKGRWSPGGLGWSASSANAIVGTVRGYF